MAITRVTQSMLAERSAVALQNALGRMAELQEHLSTGRILNRPSDSPTDTTTAMRLRTTLTEQKQYARNAQDGIGWLATAETALSSVTDQVRRARELVLQGSNSGAMGDQARKALAVEIEQIREGILSAANTKYLDRPVFGGITTGDQAYDDNGTFQGVDGAVERTVADGVRLRVNVDGSEAFGPGSDSDSDGFPDNVFGHLEAAAAAVTSGDATDLKASLEHLAGDLDTITSAVTRLGSTYNRIDQATLKAGDQELALTNALKEVENADLPRTIVDLQMQEIAYQASLAATARVMQPSLVDFLR